MKLFWWLLPVLLVALATVVFDADAQGKKTAISWKKIVLDTQFRSEGVAVADVNKDGKPDVIVGDCWYEAPKDPADPWKRHILRIDRKFDLLVYSKSFGCFADDFNGDGWADVIVIPFPGEPCYWYENPREKGGLWKEHMVTNSSCNETPIYVDLFKTGKRTLVMGWNPQKDEKDFKKGNYDDRGEMCYFLPAKDPTQPWERISVSGPSVKGKTIPGTARFAHGLGHGDVNGDGRPDVIVPQGWWEQPAKADGAPWKFHAANISGACADMHVMDIDGDGKADIVSTSAHGYGFWWSQQKDANSFVQRAFFPLPSDAAKLGKDHGLNAEEKGVYDAINKMRTDQFKRAPFALDPELCSLARAVAREAGNPQKKAIDIHKSYSGKVIHVAFTGSTPDELKKLAETLLPNNDKQGNLVQPQFVIGVGIGQGYKGMNCCLIIGDRGHFSLPSQTHALVKADIDGDGLADLVTGRRWWAHGPKGDAGPGDPAYLYWFQAKRSKDGMISFTPHLIDDNSGMGTQFSIADMNGDGLPDVIVANKKGVHVLLQAR